MAGRNGEPGGAFQRFVAALKSRELRVNQRDEGATAQCPHHNDTDPSLSITDAEDRVLVKCHAGCAIEDVIEALGLSMTDLFNDSEGATSASVVQHQVDEYIYSDEQGEPLYRVVRYEPKSFRQQGWNGTAWDPTLGDARRVLYRLPELLTGIANRQWVFVVEGEKDADRLVAEGFTATTIAMGSNLGNWERTETTVLNGAYVAVIGDNDGPGRKYARHVANSLHGRAAEARLLRLTGLAEKGDISDWLDSENTVADLAQILESTPGWKPRSKFDGAEPFATVGDVSAYTADSLRPWAQKRTEWRIRGVLVKDTHLVVGASKKTLKTTLVSGEMAFAIANGTHWLGYEQFAVEAAAPVIAVINEGIRSYVKMLDRIPARHNADSLGPIYVIDASGIKLENGDLNAAIRETAERVGAGVIIYDAWYGFVGGDKKAESLFSMSDVFKVVQAVADELEIDPVIVHHRKKNMKGRPDLDDLAFAGVAEWADSWLLITHRSTARPDDGEYRLGLVAGSRQWGEIDYEIDASFGEIDLDSAGYTQPPRWMVTKVDADTAERWGKRSGDSTVNPETSLTDFVAAHPCEYTKSQVCKLAPGAEKANRDAFDRLAKSGRLVVTKARRMEGDRSVLRSLVGPSGVDPASTEQQRSVPIGNDLPTNVGEHGAGNSPEAAVSAPSEPRLDANLGGSADVDNPGTPTLSNATSAPTDVPDRRSGITSYESHRGDQDPPDDSPLCIRCGEHHPPTPPGRFSWTCYAIETERELRRLEGTA